MSGTVALGLLIALVVGNQVVMRVRRLADDERIFWANLVVQAGAGVAALVVDLPGADAVPMVRWLLAVLFGMHVVQDLAVRAQRRTPDEPPPA